jgi:ubiquinone biosynthesis protein Coq4
MTSPILTYRIARMMISLVRDPSRLDVVFSFTDAILRDAEATAQIARMLEQPAAAEACARRLRTPALDLAQLDTMPEGSLGRAAADFFRAHGLDPGALPRREPTNDVEWLTAHLYETHDLWHAITGFLPDVAGELGLQAFYASQTVGPFPVAILAAGLLNTLLYAPEGKEARLAAIARGWEMGRRAAPFVGVDWTPLLAQPLAAVRAKLAITVGLEEDAAGAARAA